MLRDEFFLNEKYQACPYHTICCLDWEIVNIDEDVCAHEIERTPCKLRFNYEAEEDARASATGVEQDTPGCSIPQANTERVL